MGRKPMKVRHRELGKKVKKLQLGGESHENTRESDDEEMLFAGDDVVDEFTRIVRNECTPKILIMKSSRSSTSSSSFGAAFISHLLSVIPNAHYHERGTCELKKIVDYANDKEFTSVIIVHSDRRGPESLLVVGLPDGPTACFKFSNLRIPKDIKNHGKPTTDNPELILTNFTSPLEHRLGRMLQSLFPQNPVSQGRRVVTFHNQRDFIVFRHHHYIFETKEGKQTEAKGKKSNDEKNLQGRTIARLKECGPRFTLKLMSLQRGTCSSDGEYEWVHKPEMKTRRHTWVLPEFQGLRI